MKPKSQRQELRRIIEALKDKEQRKVYKDGGEKRGSNSNTMNMRGKSTEHSVSRSVNVEMEQTYVVSYAYRTRQGCLATNPSKPNQDSLLIKSKLCGENTHLFAVADGHGAYGHHVSQFAAKNLSKLLESSLKSLNPI